MINVNDTQTAKYGIPGNHQNANKPDATQNAHSQWNMNHNTPQTQTGEPTTTQTNAKSTTVCQFLHSRQTHLKKLITFRQIQLNNFFMYYTLPKTFISNLQS